jgi:RNA polymerase sigma-70 factor (ECF subfamily)
VGHDQTAFAEFFQASWEPCLRAVVVTTGDMLRAEEQVAEAFARAWASWSKVGRHPAPRAWVVRTALNVGASSWRHRGRELPLADHDAEVPAAAGSDLDAGVLIALRRLPVRQREVIALRVLLDLDGASAARVLGISRTACSTRLSRALKRLEEMTNDVDG